MLGVSTHFSALSPIPEFHVLVSLASRQSHRAFSGVAAYSVRSFMYTTHRSPETIGGVPAAPSVAKQLSVTLKIAVKSCGRGLGVRKTVVVKYATWRREADGCAGVEAFWDRQSQ